MILTKSMFLKKTPKKLKTVYSLRNRQHKIFLILSVGSKKKNYGEGSKSKTGFPKQPDWFIDARGFKNLEIGLKKVGFSFEEVNGILGNNWFNFYKGIN